MPVKSSVEKKILSHKLGIIFHAITSLDDKSNCADTTNLGCYGVYN